VRACARARFLLCVFCIDQQSAVSNCSSAQSSQPIISTLFAPSTLQGCLCQHLIAQFRPCTSMVRPTAIRQTCKLFQLCTCFHPFRYCCHGLGASQTLLVPVVLHKSIGASRALILVPANKVAAFLSEIGKSQLLLRTPELHTSKKKPSPRTPSDPSTRTTPFILIPRSGN
jgi:hypothetical protein